MTNSALYNDFVEAQLVEFGEVVDNKLVDFVVYLLAERSFNHLYVVMQVGYDNILLGAPE